jgi:hypothetical protein
MQKSERRRGHPMAATGNARFYTPPPFLPSSATRWPFLTRHDVPQRVDCHGAHYCYRSTHSPPNGTTPAVAGAVPRTTRLPRHSFPPRSRHSHPFALPDPSRYSKTCGLPWGTLLLQVPAHPNKRDHGCGGRELYIQTLLSKSVFKEGPCVIFTRNFLANSGKGRLAENK